jgi:hypothetical protein
MSGLEDAVDRLKRMAYRKPKYFSEFSDEEQNFIIENNFERLKRDVIEWNEVCAEWRIFLIQEEKKIGINNLKYQNFNFDKFIFINTEVVTNLLETTNILIENSKNNEEDILELNKIKNVYLTMSEILEKDFTYNFMYDKIVRKNGIRTSTANINGKLQVIKEYSNDPVILKNIKAYELKSIYKAEGSYELTEIFINFIHLKEKELVFFQTFLAKKIMVLQTKMQEKLDFITSKKGIKKLLLEKKDVLFTKFGPPEYI